MAETPPPESCPDPDVLAGLTRGELEKGESERLRQHVVGCRRCGDLQAGSALPPPSSGNATAAIGPPQALAAESTLEPLEKTSVGTAPRAEHPLLATGSHIGRYVVLGKLGEGGMGIIYAAWDPELNRKVALKLLHARAPGAGSGAQKSSGHQQRLLREAQALAQLSHPNVVGVHDVGTFQDSVFIAMELVEGVNLREWFKASQRSWQEVLRVFKEAGKGLAAAHSKGLVHRDFKPDNVLLSAEGRVYVLDFGLARAEHQGHQTEELQGSETDSGQLLHTPLTQAGALLGTKPYMAQELLAGEPADARTDLFAFAVSLYEVLYGERPFPSQGKRVLREPPADRHVPPWLRRIVLKGLSDSPGARQASMGELLQELEQDPAPRRRQLLIAAGLLCVLGAAAFGLQQVSSARSQLCQGESEKLRGIWDEQVQSSMRQAFLATRADDAGKTWERASRALNGYAEKLVAARTQACVDTRVKGTQTDEVFTLKMECLDRRLTDLQALTTVLSQPQGEVMAKAVEAANTLTPLEACNNLQALRAPVRPPEAPQTRAKVAELNRELARVKALTNTGEYQRALEVVAPITEEVKGLDYRPIQAEALLLMGKIQRQTMHDEVANTLRPAVFAALAGKHYEAAIDACVELIWAAYAVRKFPEVPIWAGVARSSLEAIGGNAKLEADLLSALAGVAGEEKPRSRESLELSAKALALNERIFGPEDARLASSHNNLGDDYRRFREFEPAFTHLQKAMELMIKDRGADHPVVSYPLANLGKLFQTERGPTKEAEDYLLESIRIREAKLGPDNPRVVSTRSHLARLYLSRGQYRQALETSTRVLAAIIANDPDDNAAPGVEQNRTGSLRALGRFAEAVETQQRSCRMVQKAYAPDDPDLADCPAELGLSFVAAGRRPEALAEYRKAVAIWEKILGTESPEYARGQQLLGSWYLESGKTSEALPYLERSLALYEKTLGPQHKDAGEVLLLLGQAQLKSKQPEKAKGYLERAVEVLSKANLAPELQGEARFGLAQALTMAGAPGDAARARALATEAGADFHRSEIHDRARRLERVQAWLRAQEQNAP